MRVGLALPQFDWSVPGEWPLQWETVVDWARHAEGLGFESLWLADHLFLDLARYGGSPEPGGCIDPLPALAALAGVTARPRLGTLVLCAPLRPPSLLAKALASLDVVSGGRLIVGMGAGWYEPEFAAAGIPFLAPGQRLVQLAEAIKVLEGMFDGGPFTFEGRYWRVAEARCLPQPVQRPRPPIWVGGRGDAILRLVARHADGWNTVWRWTHEAYRQRLAVLAEACETRGRDPATVTLSLGLTTLVGEDERDLRRRFDRYTELAPAGVVDGTSFDDWRQGRLVGTVDQVQEQIEAWADLGVSELIVGAGAVPFAVAHPDDLEMVAQACSLGAPWEASEPRN